MKFAVFSAMTMLAGFCAGHVIADPYNAAGAVMCLVTVSFFGGLAFSKDLK